MMPPIEPQDARDWLTVVLSYWGRYPVIATLVVMMFVDIVTGIMAAAAKGHVSSKVSMQGAMKKSFVLIIVGVAAVLERLQSDVPLSKLTATFFLFTEGMSILENARRCGVPIPKVIDDALQNLNNSREAADTTVTKTTKLDSTETETTETKHNPPHNEHTSDSWRKRNGQPVPTAEDFEKHGPAVMERARKQEEKESKEQ